MLEIFLVVELKNRIAADKIWVAGSRTYRALEEKPIPPQTFVIIKAEARIGAKGLRVPAVRTADSKTIVSHVDSSCNIKDVMLYNLIVQCRLYIRIDCVR